MHQDRTWLYVTLEEFKKIKDSFECKNLEKIYQKRLWFYWWEKMPDIVEHYIKWNTYVKIPLWLISFWDDRIENNIITNKVNHPEFIDFEEKDIELT